MSSTVLAVDVDKSESLLGKRVGFDELTLNDINCQQCKRPLALSINAVVKTTAQKAVTFAIPPLKKAKVLSTSSVPATEESSRLAARRNGRLQVQETCR